EFTSHDDFHLFSFSFDVDAEDKPFGNSNRIFFALHTPTKTTSTDRLLDIIWETQLINAGQDSYQERERERNMKFWRAFSVRWISRRGKGDFFFICGSFLSQKQNKKNKSFLTHTDRHIPRKINHLRHLNQFFCSKN